MSSSYPQYNQQGQGQYQQNQSSSSSHGNHNNMNRDQQHQNQNQNQNRGSSPPTNNNNKGKGKANDRDRDRDRDDDDERSNDDRAGGGGGGGGRKTGGGSGINRVNRACNGCRRMKMRCVGAEDPPCKRCRHTGQECVLEKPSKPTTGGTGGAGGGGSGGLEGVGDDRIKHLEQSVTSIQSTLADLVSAIRTGGLGGMGGGAGSASSSSPAQQIPFTGGGGGGGGQHHYPGSGGGGGGPGYDASPASTGSFPGSIHHQQQQQAAQLQQQTLSNAADYLVGLSAGLFGGTGGGGNNNHSPQGQFGGGQQGNQQQQQQQQQNFGALDPRLGRSASYSQPGNPHDVVVGNHSFDDMTGLGGMNSFGGLGGSSVGYGGMAGGGVTTQMDVDHVLEGLLKETGRNNPQNSNVGPTGVQSYGNTPSGTGQPMTSPASAMDPPWFSYRGGTASPASGLINQGAGSGNQAVAGPSNNGSSNNNFGNNSNINSGTGQVTTPSPYTSMPPPALTSIRSTQIHSAVGSPNGSDDEGDADPLAPEKIMAPLENMRGMAELAHAAVERARLEKMKGVAGGSGGNGKSKAEDDGDRPNKRRRVEGDIGAVGSGGLSAYTTNAAGETQSSGRNEPKRIGSVAEPLPTGPKMIVEEKVGKGGKSKRKKEHIHAFPDVVALGLVSEEEGRELFELFFEGSSHFVPAYDPKVDTWDELRIRSPFSISTIIAVGARVRDGGGPMSEVHRVALDHSRRIAIGTLFTPVNRVEAVQSMILISAWNDNGWLPGGHAVRMAVDMGLDKCFSKLLRQGMGVGQTQAELEADRPLVVGARVWFCLYMIEHQMSYGVGKSAIIREDESILQCRRLLEHPLSIVSDVRLISTVELIALRAPLHTVLTSSPEEPVDQVTVDRLKQANQEFDRWQTFWDRIMSDRFGKGKTDFLRESLAAQREYSSLFINSQLLRGISEAADVKKMPKDKRDLALQAMRNAQSCLDICIRGANYRKGLKYAVHYTHVCAAFAASFLIRIARLFPKELDLKKTAKDVEELASILSDVPAGRYARSLRLILRKARKQKVIPPPSMPTSPSKMALTLLGSGSHNPNPNQPQNPGGPSPNSMLPGTPSTGFPIPGYSPSAILHSALLAHSVSPNNNPQPGVGASGIGSSGPGGQLGKDESPQSASDPFGSMDFNYTQELMQRAGLRLDDDAGLGSVPLFFNSESLGGDVGGMVGLEGFFLPPSIDSRLVGDLGFTGVNSNPEVPWPQDNMDTDNVWW